MKKLRVALPYLLSILCIIGCIYYLYEQIALFDPSTVSKEMVSEWEEHMKPVRGALPSDVRIVGYLDASDILAATTTYDDAEFFMTQYALAPVALEKGFRTAWIIGNFGNTISPKDLETWLERTLNKYEVQDFGFGIYLIHHIPE